VAHKDVDPQATRKLIETTYATEFATVVQPPLDPKLMDLPPEYPWHAGARQYLERNQPLVSGPLIDSAHKGIAILAAAASGLFVLWQWSKQHGQFMRDQGFNRYIRQVTRLEEQAMRAEGGLAPDLPQLRSLRDQLGRLKTEALDRFTEGELAGRDLLAGFLVQVNEARDFLTRLMQRHEERFKIPAGKDGDPLVEA